MRFAPTIGYGIIVQAPLFKACVRYFLSIFFFLDQMIALQKL